MKTDLHIAYKRVSTTDQNTARQLEGVSYSVCFEDKLSGKDTNRPELQKLLSDEGLSRLHNITLHVHSLDRLARNLQDLQDLVHRFLAKGWRVVFHKENLTFEAGAGSAMQTLLLQMLGAVAQFERALIKERQAEGIAVAKAKGVYKGRKAALAPDQVVALRIEAATTTNKAALAKKFGISRSCLYNYLTGQELC